MPVVTLITMNIWNNIRLPESKVNFADKKMFEYFNGIVSR